jgi:hypothetical protein
MNEYQISYGGSYCLGKYLDQSIIGVTPINHTEAPAMSWRSEARHQGSKLSLIGSVLILSELEDVESKAEYGDSQCTLILSICGSGSTRKVRHHERVMTNVRQCEIDYL